MTSIGFSPSDYRGDHRAQHRAAACCSWYRRQWASGSDHTGARRLDDPGDYVRLEILAALARDLRVIRCWSAGPHAAPEELPDRCSRWCAGWLSSIDARFHADTDRLIAR